MTEPTPYWMKEPGLRHIGEGVRDTMARLVGNADKPDNSDSTRQDRTQPDTTGRGQTGRFPGSLTAAIDEYIANSTGWFTNADIDRELCLTDRRDKKRRSEILIYRTRSNKLRRDPRRADRWQVVQVELDFVDLDAADEKPFGLRLPLDLDTMVSIPPQSIIVLAGSTNSGKTALALNTILANLGGPHQLLYLMSEMGNTEYKQRVTAFGNDLSRWKSVKAAPLSSGFNAAISTYNPDGLTVVDFLEEVEGEYYKIASDIRGIYDALGNGVALVVLQKATTAAWGRGGQATAEKARLYLSLDVLTHRPRSTCCALKIIKAKSYTGENPNGKERHFRIERGHKITPLSDWMWCNEHQRAAYVCQYEEYER